MQEASGFELDVLQTHHSVNKWERWVGRWVRRTHEAVCFTPPSSSVCKDSFTTTSNSYFSFASTSPLLVSFPPSVQTLIKQESPVKQHFYLSSPSPHPKGNGGAAILNKKKQKQQPVFELCGSNVIKIQCPAITHLKSIQKCEYRILTLLFCSTCHGNDVVKGTGLPN